jgi:hypothetical protein
MTGTTPYSCVLQYLMRIPGINRPNEVDLDFESIEANLRKSKIEMKKYTDRKRAIAPTY